MERDVRQQSAGAVFLRYRAAERVWPRLPPIIEPRVQGNVLIGEGQAPVASEQLRKIFKGKIIAAGGFEPDSAEAIVEKGDADLVTFGRYFVSNPDLPERIKRGLPLNDYDRDTFYTFDAHGYTDYPFYDLCAAA
jgi:N-ethylmaleimide reductase